MEICSSDMRRINPRSLSLLSLLAFLGFAQGALAQIERIVAWGTQIDPRTQSQESRALAQASAQPGSPDWRAKGDQLRRYRFPAVNAELPYRLCVPSQWNGRDPLPLVMFLHGAGNNESSYLDQNGKQMVKLAEQHGVILVSPSGHQGAYGTFIRLPAVFDEQAEADKMLAQVTDQTVRNNELSEKDVINVLERVLHEYPVDSSRIFLTGHSMGSGGTWYLGAKYAYYWRALAPMSGPFVLKQGYPWETVLKMPVFVTEGSNTASTESSRRLRDWMRQQQGEVAFKEVGADHAGMVPLVLPDVFAFFDSVSARPVALNPRARTVSNPAAPASFRRIGTPLYPVQPGPGHSGHSGHGTGYVDLRGRWILPYPSGLPSLAE